jgi:hypothetical protein
MQGAAENSGAFRKLLYLNFPHPPKKKDAYRDSWMDLHITEVKIKPPHRSRKAKEIKGFLSQ